MSLSSDLDVETSQTSLPDIKRYWQQASLQQYDSSALRPTARDPYLQDNVDTAMEKWLWQGSTVLDVGCGDGTSTLRFARRAGFVHGVDFIERYVDMARADAAQHKVGNVVFAWADVMDLAATRARIGLVDVAVSTRCLINLANWDNQRAALSQIKACIKPGGLFLLSEGWSDGWSELNRLRGRCGLPPIELVKYNCLLNRAQFEREVSSDFEILHYESFGFYIFMSRIFQPAFVAPDAPMHRHDINRVAAQLSQLGIGANEFRNVDYSGVYVLRRKENCVGTDHQSAAASPAR